jgi:hypothetical protein
VPGSLTDEDCGLGEEKGNGWYGVGIECRLGNPIRGAYIPGLDRGSTSSFEEVFFFSKRTIVSVA